MEDLQKKLILCTFSRNSQCCQQNFRNVKYRLISNELQIDISLSVHDIHRKITQFSQSIHLEKDVCKYMFFLKK